MLTEELLCRGHGWQALHLKICLLVNWSRLEKMRLRHWKKKQPTMQRELSMVLHQATQRLLQARAMAFREQ
jgi:hypothetical protein